MDSRPFEEEFPKLFRVAYRAAFRITGDTGAAEDVAAEALTRAALRWSHLAGRSGPWVVRVASNLAIDHVRHLSRQKRFRPDRSDQPSSDHHATIDLHRSLRTLPRRQREVSTSGVLDCTTWYNQLMATMTASEARAALPAILDRVADGEEVTITRHGQVVAVVVGPDALRVRRADRALGDAERLRIALDRARTTALADEPAMNAARADELVAEVAEGRHGR